MVLAKADLCLPYLNGLIFIQEVRHPDQQRAVYWVDSEQEVRALVSVPEERLNLLVQRLTERQVVAGHGARLADVSVEAGDARGVGEAARHGLGLRCHAASVTRALIPSALLPLTVYATFSTIISCSMPLSSLLS